MMPGGAACTEPDSDFAAADCNGGGRGGGVSVAGQGVWGGAAGGVILQPENKIDAGNSYWRNLEQFENQ